MTEETQHGHSLDASFEVEAANEKRPCLIMIRGDFIGEVYELVNGVTRLGRSDDVDLVVSDISISRRHAMIVRYDDEFHVSDLDSTNGTFINRELVSSPRKLVEGDKLTIGMITFKFSYLDDDDTEYHFMLRNMAIKDGLTHIYNKRYFEDALEKEFNYNLRNRAGLALVLFDVDNFKELNDTHGHPAGDFMLKDMAQRIENEARGYDVFARFGGEEFVLMMRVASLVAAESLAERVRAIVEKNTIVYEDVELNVTISLGICFWNGDDSIAGPGELIGLADKQLYEAKRSGRNCIRSLDSGA